MKRPETRTRRSGTVRCAVYTRKSSEEGLDQEFNSLQAQREACEAFINSQRHEGWVCLRAAYDDGGFSGATMDRPALQQLLADLTAGRVDTVVVYKIDRLTRSLADFAKIVEILDARGASFVSVTQQFNTTTSMGRLTLNVLLSFAQFEREVIGERIRDKIAASKRKGMWMGGVPPLGYQARRPELWPTLARELYCVHKIATTSPDVREGSRWPTLMWERDHYDWSMAGCAGPSKRATTPNLAATRSRAAVSSSDRSRWYIPRTWDH